MGSGKAGVLGQSVADVGVLGTANSGEGVYGQSDTAAGGHFFSSSGPSLILENATSTRPSNPQSGSFWVNHDDFGLWYYESPTWIQLA
jgi:hypothetical protein